MRRIGAEGTVQRSHIRQVAFASIGTAIEWYDFFLYRMTAALVFPKLFFPAFSPLAAMLASFATFGVAFLTRPIGGVVFGAKCGPGGLSRPWSIGLGFLARAASGTCRCSVEFKGSESALGGRGSLLNHCSNISTQGCARIGRLLHLPRSNMGRGYS
jgi:hypothetical protein